MKRREFCCLPLLAMQAARAPRPLLCLFSKHLPKLNYQELGKTVKRFGFDGVDLTVRPQGHVLPERAAGDLPRAAAVIRDQGVEVAMITTGLLSASDPAAKSTLSAAGRLKIPFYKLGYWKYARQENIEARIAEVRRDVSSLIALGREFGVTAGFHNHSGDNVGEAVWDTQAIIGDMDPRWIGYYFDPCHATAEGGVAGWNIAMRLALPRLKMVALKDFYWEKSKGQWKMKMCPMGEGMVDWAKVFSMLAAARFAGPISLHIEYEPADEMAAIARDYEFARKQITTAYGGIA